MEVASNEPEPLVAAGRGGEGSPLRVNHAAGLDYVAGIGSEKAVDADEGSIRSLIARWHGATAEGDVDAVLALMSEDVEFLVPGREPMRGRAAFAAGLRTLLRTHRIRSSGEVQEVQVSGELAFALTRLEVLVIPLAAGQESARRGYALSVFRKQPDGAWLLVRDANLLPAPA